MKRLTLLAWGLAASFVAIGVVGFILAFPEEKGDVVGVAGFTVVLVTTLVVGLLIATRRPRHPIGWLLLTGSVLAQYGLHAKGYAEAALIERPGSLPLGETAAWLSHWVAIPAFFVLGFVFLVFPSGRLPSRRWRLPVAVGVVAIVLGSAATALKPGPIDGLPGVQNPLGVGGLEGFRAVAEGMQTYLAALYAAAIVSMFLRYRRASGEERSQMKMLAFGTGVVPIFLFGASAVDAMTESAGVEGEYVEFFLVLLGLLSPVLAIGIAILRYRLYDIDVVINRTLVYLALTVLLAGAYLGIVVLLQTALAPVTEGSDLAIAASTLAVAALFRPLRRRVQAFIDRRFYRRKYDAARTLEAFAGRLRQEVNLEDVTTDLVGVVQATVQPAHVSLWLRTEKSR